MECWYRGRYLDYQSVGRRFEFQWFFILKKLLKMLNKNAEMKSVSIIIMH